MDWRTYYSQSAPSHLPRMNQVPVQPTARLVKNRRNLQVFQPLILATQANSRDALKIFERLASVVLLTAYLISSSDNHPTNPKN